MIATLNLVISYLWLILEIPLAILSFIFFKIMKFVIGLRYNALLSRQSQRVLDWRPLCKEVLETPITLPFWMTFGPRLNTHAIIATVGPFTVEETIELHISAAQKSAKSWTIVVYRFPDYKTIIRVGSGSSELNELKQDWKKLELDSGQYLLGLRYYHWPKKVEFPAVKVDGIDLISPKILSGSINNFYHQLRNQENAFYLCLHYYIFTLLRLRSWLPQAFVKREFLPVGDPSLIYFYGIFFEGNSINFNLNSLLFKNYDVYITLYDRASFVVDFYQICEEKHTAGPTEIDGFYLVRVREKPDLQERFIDDWFKTTVIPSVSDCQVVA
ncbi:MAG: DUF6208 family protein [Leptolyngbyaceae cyanobacterium]